MHSSVKLRHMLSAFRLSRRSALAIFTRVRASAAAASRLLYTCGLMDGLDFARAECKSGCMEGSEGLNRTDVPGDPLRSRPRFGEGDIVVMVVVAVSGRSPVAVEIAAPDEAGSFAVSSSFLNLDLRSSSSSNMVDGAVVETVDSVPSALGVGEDSCS